MELEKEELQIFNRMMEEEVIAMEKSIAYRQRYLEEMELDKQQIDPQALELIHEMKMSKEKLLKQVEEVNLEFEEEQRKLEEKALLEEEEALLAKDVAEEEEIEDDISHDN